MPPLFAACIAASGDKFDWFFLVMAHWQLAHKEEARRWYDKGAQWMDARKSNSDAMVRFRNEAAELLDVAQPQSSPDPPLKEK